jgi:uncharacterized protein YbcI
MAIDHHGGEGNGGGVLTDLSNAMVRFFKEQFGRGPTRVRSDWAGSDTLICRLWETLTPAERNMAAMGEHTRLRETRLWFQTASENEIRRLVEGITGRKVVGFMSGIDTSADLAVEVFVLEPAALPPAPGPVA